MNETPTPQPDAVPDPESTQSGPVAPSAPSSAPVFGEPSTTPADGPPSPPYDAATGPSGPTRFFDRIRGFGAVRPDTGRWIAGVCAGLARRYDVDPILVRGGFVALSLFFGIGLLAYGVAWLLLPQPDGRIHVEQAAHQRLSPGFFGAALTFFAGLKGTNGSRFNLGAPQAAFETAANLTALAIIVVLVWWLVSPQARRRTRPTPHIGPQGADAPASRTPGQGAYSPRSYSAGPYSGGPQGAGPYSAGPAEEGSTMTTQAPELPGYPAPSYPGRTYPGQSYPSQSYPSPAYGTPPPFTPAFAPVGPAPARRPRASKTITRITLGIALITLAGLELLHRTVDGVHPYSFSAMAGYALIIVSVGVLVAGVRGRTGGGLIPIAIVLALVGLPQSSPIQVNGPGTGTRAWTAGVNGGTDFQLGIGTGVLDLTNPAFLAGLSADQVTNISAQVGLGELVVYVPKNVTTHVVAEAGLGDVNVPGITTSSSSSGVSANADGTLGNGPTEIELTAKVGVGDVRVVVKN